LIIDFPAPSPNGDNGRGPRGQFGKGNRYGKGNPQAKQAAAWRRALLQSIKPADLKAIIKKLVELARAGEPWAVREVLQRTLGSAVPTDALQRIEELEVKVFQEMRR
jgi:hypothetical protein